MTIYIRVDELKDETTSTIQVKTRADITLSLDGKFSVPELQKFKPELEAFCDERISKALVKRLTLKGGSK